MTVLSNVYNTQLVPQVKMNLMTDAFQDNLE